MKRSILVASLLILVAVAAVSLITGIFFHPEGMGRGRGGSGFASVSIYTQVIPTAAMIGMLALFIYYTALPEIPNIPVQRADAGRSSDKENERQVAQVKSVDESLRFLDADERRVCEILREAGGNLLQKEIAWKTGYSKVKTHRIVYRLVKRGAVNVEKYYNTNKVSLKSQLPEK